MVVLGESQYRVFGSATFGGNPVTLFEVSALDDAAALLHVARASRTEDNVFFLVATRETVLARFFSSQAELWLCGHGLLALAHHLREGNVKGVRVVHSTFGAWHVVGDAQETGVLMPAQRGSAVSAASHWMKHALHGIGLAHDKLYECPNGVWVVVLRKPGDLQTMDAARLAAMSAANAMPGASNDTRDRGSTTPGALIATVPLQGGTYAFRYFAPWHGKQEDSGTGSAHCYLAPLMLGSPAPVTALQFSPHGTAEMRVSLRDDVVALFGRVEGGRSTPTSPTPQRSARKPHPASYRRP